MWNCKRSYHGFNLKSFTSGFSARVASNTTGGTIKLRIDAAGGTQIGSCNVGNTGGWQTWTTVNSPASGVTGVHDLYLVFSGTTSGYLLNLNHFVFTSGGSRIDLTTGTEPPGGIDDRIRLYPSPAGQEMTIEINGVPDRNVHVLIFDILGRQVLASRIKGNKNRVNTGGFSPGVYTLRLYNGQQIITKKFLKK